MDGLINHLWQSTVFVLLIALGVRALRKNSPRLRYWLWLTASVKFLIPFSLIVSTGARVPLPPETPLPLADTVVQMSTFFEPASEMSVESDSTLPVAVPNRAAFPWRLAATTIWFLGGCLLAVRWLRRWLTIRRALDQSTQLPIQSAVPILSSPALMEPGVLGLFRPVLLLPEGIAEKLTPKQFEAVLAHELRHIRCFDNLTAAVHMGVETLFWFHPLVWWIGAKLMDERERDCDEAVLRQGSRPADYARGIVQVCDTYFRTELPCASGISGSDLRQRVQEIMTWRGSLPVTVRSKTILLLAALAAVSVPFSIGIVRAQAPSQPEASPNIAGDFIGVFDGPAGPSRAGTARLQIKAAADGKISGALVDPSSKTVLTLHDILVTGRSLSFAIRVDDRRFKDTFGDTWRGSIENNGERLNGAFTLKESLRVVFTREPVPTQIPPAASTRPAASQPPPPPVAPPNAVSPADAPKWEAVSVRPCPWDVRDGRRAGLGGGPYRFAGDRMTLNCLTVRSLIRSAYRIDRDVDRVLVRGIGGEETGRKDPTDGTDGGPDWLDTDMYTIAAKAERAADRATMQGPMLQAILEERFRIKVHRQAKEVAVHALVIDKSGSKLKPFVEGSCVRFSPGASSFLGSVILVLAGQHECRIDGPIDLADNPKPVNFLYRAEGVTVGEFVTRFLSRYQGRLVFDRTGLTGKFDIRLESEIDPEYRQRVDPSGDWIGPSTAPRLPDALRQQLGLRLESAKGPVEFLVIDHIERPSPN